MGKELTANLDYSGGVPLWKILNRFGDFSRDALRSDEEEQNELRALFEWEKRSREANWVLSSKPGRQP